MPACTSRGQQRLCCSAAPRSCRRMAAWLSSPSSRSTTCWRPLARTATGLFSKLVWLHMSQWVACGAGIGKERLAAAQHTGGAGRGGQQLASVGNAVLQAVTLTTCLLLGALVQCCAGCTDGCTHRRGAVAARKSEAVGVLQSGALQAVYDLEWRVWCAVSMCVRRADSTTECLSSWQGCSAHVSNGLAPVQRGSLSQDCSLALQATLPLSQ